MNYKIRVLYVGGRSDIDLFKSVVSTHIELEYDNGFNAAQDCYKYITKSGKNYLIFLASDLPDDQGLWLARQLSHTNNAIVLLEEAGREPDQALRLYAFDYITKPVSGVTIGETIGRIGHKYKVLSSILAGSNKTIRAPEEIKRPSRIFLHMLNSIEVVVLDEILYISSQGNYSRFVKLDGTELLSSKSIKNYEAMLIDHNDFIRIQKSYIVNRKYVLSISKKLKSYKVVMINRDELEISYARKEEILKQIIE